MHRSLFWIDCSWFLIENFALIEGIVPGCTRNPPDAPTLCTVAMWAHYFSMLIDFSDLGLYQDLVQDSVVAPVVPSALDLNSVPSAPYFEPLVHHS